MSEVHSMGLYQFPSLDENIFHRLYEHPCQVNMVIPLLPVLIHGKSTASVSPKIMTY